MEKFFVIGSEDPSFKNSDRITFLPECLGIIPPDSGIIFNRYASPEYVKAVQKIKTVSLGSFLLHAKKNQDIALVSCFDFPAGREFVKKLQVSCRYKFKLYDYHQFCFEHDIPLMFLPPKQERDVILSAKNEWAEFRKQLTDDFSKLSLDCYLSAYETNDSSLMLPVYIDFSHIFFNRISRMLSLVPNKSEIYVDVGALDGDTVIQFLDSAGTYKAIHAFEPFRGAYEILEKKKFFVENMHTYPIALSNQTGEIDFITNTSGSSRAADTHTPTGTATERVLCSRLDDILDEATLLKIETEGHEAQVIEGAQHLIKKCKPDMVVHAYHYPLDPIRITEQVNKISSYKYVALRFYTVGVHIFSLFFSDRAPFV
jgi:FkbM family methyltransferase